MLKISLTENNKQIFYVLMKLNSMSLFLLPNFLYKIIV